MKRPISTKTLQLDIKQSGQSGYSILSHVCNVWILLWTLRAAVSPIVYL